MKTGKIVAAIQARMNSKRLPGKPLLKINGRTMLEHILTRVSKSEYVEFVCVSTTTNPKDDELVEFLGERKIPYTRGPENDIVGRLYQVTTMFNADILVRVWGDCPLVDPSIIDQMVKASFEKKIDCVTNSEPPSYPFGLNAEVYRASALKKIHTTVTDAFFREFPIEAIKNNRDFTMTNIRFKEDRSYINLTVDYPEDVEIIKSILEEYSKEEFFGLEQILEYYETHKNLFEKNKALARNIEYKSGLELRKNKHSITHGG